MKCEWLKNSQILGNMKKGQEINRNLKEVKKLRQVIKYMKFCSGTSLVVQWLRIHLPMQGTWV